MGERDDRLRPAVPEGAMEEPVRREPRGIHEMVDRAARLVAHLPAAGEEPEAEIALLADRVPLIEARVNTAAPTNCRLAYA